MCCSSATHAERQRQRAEYRAMLREYREARRELKMERKREKLAFKRGALEEERVRREKRGEERGKACGRRERDVMVQLPSEPMMQSREARVEVEGAPPSYERAMKDTAGVKAGGESMRGEVYPAAPRAVDSSAYEQPAQAYRPVARNAQSVTRQWQDMSKGIIGLVRNLVLHRLDSDNRGRCNTAYEGQRRGLVGTIVQGVMDVSTANMKRERGQAATKF